MYIPNSQGVFFQSDGFLTTVIEVFFHFQNVFALGNLRLRPNPHLTRGANANKWNLLLRMGVFTLDASNRRNCLQMCMLASSVDWAKSQFVLFHAKSVAEPHFFLRLSKLFRHQNKAQGYCAAVSRSQGTQKQSPQQEHKPLRFLWNWHSVLEAHGWSCLLSPKFHSPVAKESQFSDDKT